MTYTIGFSNLDASSPFCQTVHAGLEAAVAKHPDLALVVRDNALDDERALANVKEFSDMPVDLAIIFHINERISPKFIQYLTPKRIPIIAVDVPIALTKYFGINNHEAGRLAGEALGEWVNTHWDGRVDKVLALTEIRVLDAVRLRTEVAISTLAGQLPLNPQDDVLYIDCGHNHETTIERTTQVLRGWSGYDHIVAVGFNEDTTLSLVQAVRELGYESRVIVAGQGADSAALDELHRPDTPLIATTGYRPHAYGEHLVDLALRMLGGERVPQNNYIDIDLYKREPTV